VEDAHPLAGSASAASAMHAATGPGQGPRVVPVLRSATRPPVTTPPATSIRRRLAQPLRRGVAALLGASAPLIMAAAALLGLALAHGEWAMGLRAAGLTALALGAVTLVATVARAGAGRRATDGVALGLGAALLLGLLGDASLALIPATRLAQARAYEASEQFEQALTQYTLAGEHAPASRDLARVNVEWGDALTRDGRYAEALDHYLAVLERFPNVPERMAPARSGLLRAYGRWLVTGGDGLTFDNVLAQLQHDRQAAWCGAPCRDTLDQFLVQTHVADGRSFARANAHAEAAEQFDAVTAQYPTSPYAPLAHAAAAVEYLALGKALRASATCANAVPTYQKLATTFADTPEGASARQELAAPVMVTGSLAGYPTEPAPTMYLSRHIAESTIFSDDYHASLSAAGTFTFSGVAAGSYNLSAALPDGSGIHWYDAQTGNPYNIVVGPLCPLALPAYSWG
jgi:tetratricopeptide (TPR) repeat protein